MTISSCSASRRYFDRSSLISDRATRFIATPMFRQPGIGFGFRHDGQNQHGLFAHVVKHPNVIADAEAVLGMGEPPQSLDAAPAHFGWLMPQVLFEGVAHRGADVRLEVVQV